MVKSQDFEPTLEVVNKMQDKFSITNKTRGVIPSLPFLAIKDDILGKKYSLSLAFIDEKTSRNINKTYRKKDKATNILSFSLSKTEGEIVMCPQLIKKEIRDKNKNFNKNYSEFLGFLVIHGMLHLKGMQHSAIMERAEKKYDKKHLDRNRHRLINDKSRGGRVHQRRKKS